MRRSKSYGSAVAGRQVNGVRNVPCSAASRSFASSTKLGAVTTQERLYRFKREAAPWKRSYPKSRQRSACTKSRCSRKKEKSSDVSTPNAPCGGLYRCFGTGGLPCCLCGRQERQGEACRQPDCRLRFVRCLHQ